MKSLFLVLFIFTLNAFAVQRDHYEVLELDRDATLDEIKGSYRKLALKYHPDRNAHLPAVERQKLEEKFKEVSVAHEVLSDPEKRSEYDRHGPQAMPRSAGGPTATSSPDFQDVIFEFSINILGQTFTQRVVMGKVSRSRGIEVLHHAFYRVFGRAAYQNEVDHLWPYIHFYIADEQSLVNTLLDWLRSPGGNYEVESEEIVRRAFHIVKGVEPRWNDVNAWKKAIRDYSLTFEQVKTKLRSGWDPRSCRESMGW